MMFLFYELNILNKKQLKSYNEFLQQEKMEKLERQKQYQDILKRQVTSNHKKKEFIQADENYQKKLNNNKMSNAEKRMNFLDLQVSFMKKYYIKIK